MVFVEWWVQRNIKIVKSHSFAERSPQMNGAASSSSPNEHRPVRAASADKKNVPTLRKKRRRVGHPGVIALAPRSSSILAAADD